MKTELKEVSPTRRELNIEIPAEEVKKAYNKAAQKYSRAVQVPGFRKGFAPLDIVKTRYKEEIKNEVFRDLLPAKVQTAIEENDLSPLGEPHLHIDDVENVQINGSAPISLQVHVEVMPEIPTPDYKNLEAVRRVRPIADEQIEKIIEERRMQSAAFVPVENRKSQDGDTLIIDLEGKFTGKPEEQPIKADDLEIKLGDERIEKAFTENLAGLAPEDEKEFTVEYPADFASPGLAGQKVEYKAKIKSLGTVELPEADDEWAKSIDESIGSVGDLRKRLREDLELASKMEADNRVRDDLVRKLIEDYQFEVPNALVDHQARNLLNNFAQDLQRQGANLDQIGEDFIKMAYEQMRGQAERDVRGALLLEKIAELEKVDVTGDEIAEEINRMASYYHISHEDVRRNLSQHGGESSVGDRLRSRKAVDVLFEGAKITDGEWVDESQATADEQETAEEKPKAAKAKTAKKKEAEEPGSAESEEQKNKKSRKKSD